jgi:hypothetical protein
MSYTLWKVSRSKLNLQGPAVIVFADANERNPYRQVWTEAEIEAGLLFGMDTNIHRIDFEFDETVPAEVRAELERQHAAAYGTSHLMAAE